jgi:hypothetical protein
LNSAIVTSSSWFVLHPVAEGAGEHRAHRRGDVVVALGEVPGEDDLLGDVPRRLEAAAREDRAGRVRVHAELRRAGHAEHRRVLLEVRPDRIHDDVIGQVGLVHDHAALRFGGRGRHRPPDARREDHHAVLVHGP